MSMQTQPTLHPQQGRIIDRLCSLIRVDFDAADACEAAIERIASASYKEQLREFLADYRTHIRELSASVRTLGNSAPRQGDVRRYLTRGAVVLATIAGDRAILRALRGTAQQVALAYERSFVRLAPVSLEVRQVVERALADVRRHKAWYDSQIESRPS